MSNLAMMMGLGSAAGFQWKANLANASYDSVSLSVTAQTTSVKGMAFSEDGTYLFCLNFGGPLYKYTLSTAWDISSASFTESVNYFRGSSERGLYFSPDGLNFYVTDNTGDTADRYNIAAAYNLQNSGETFTDKTGIDTVPWGIFLSTDGTKMFIAGQSGQDITEFSLSTAWDVTTASETTTFSVSSQDTEPTGLYFSSDGLYMYVVGDIGNDINEY